MRRRSFRSNGGRADISKRRASVVHAAASGRQPSGVALRAVPRPNFWHAPTSNEIGWGMPARDGQWLLASRYPVLDPEEPNPAVSTDDGAVQLRYSYLLPTTPQSRCTVVYRVAASGRIEVTIGLEPGEGLPDLPEFGMLFTAPSELAHLTWYGQGPDESYVDRRAGARLGVYSGSVANQLTPYVRP